MKTVVLKMHCDAGWFDAAGEFIANAVLIDLNLDTGMVRPHFEHDPEVLNACGPSPLGGLLFEPAGLEDGSWLILQPAWDFARRAAGFHIAYPSLCAHRLQLLQWAKLQETLSLVHLCYRRPVAESGERLAA